MLAERWKRLRAAYDAVMDAPAAERRRLLDEWSGSDPEFGRELHRLVAADPDAAAFLETPLARLGPPRLEPGLVLSGRFTLLRLLGRGGMGEVWAAHDHTLNADIAVKMVRVVGEARPDLRRFTREIQMARRISHPNVCRVYEFFEDTAATPPRAYLTMELLEGETLAARLGRTGALPAAEALVVFQQIARGLEAAHDAGIIHRDLKPSNIMLLDGSSSRHAVVMDFGLARDHVRVESDGTTLPGTLVGTPEYMAPEQVSGQPATPATDIYALGLILFEMLRGTRPFASSSTLDSWMRRAREGPEKLSGAVPGVQARVDALIRRCLEYDTVRRPQSVRELLDALDGAFYLPVPKSRRFWLTAAVVAVMAGASAGAWAWSRNRSALPPAEALKWYEDAQQALAEGASVRAFNTITRAIDLAPSFAPAHAALAEIRLEMDMPSAAQEAMLRANELGRDRGGLPETYVAYMDGIHALLQHQCTDAVMHLRRAADLADASVRPYRLLTTVRAMERCERFDAAETLLDSAAKVDPRNAAVPVRRARFQARRQQYDLAYASLRDAEALFRDRNNTEGVGEALAWTGTFLVEQGELDAASATLNRGRQIAETIGDTRQIIRVDLQRAILFRKRGDLEAAIALTDAALSLGRREGLESLTLEGLLAGANAHLVKSEFDNAATLYAQAMAIAEAQRHERIKARIHVNLASLSLRRSDPEQARALLDAARPYFARIGEVRSLSVVDLLDGQIRVMKADFAGAVRHFSAALEGARVLRDWEQVLVARDNLATAMLAVGWYGDAALQFMAVRDAYYASRRFRAAAFAAINVADALSRLGLSQDEDPLLREVLQAAGPDPEVESRWASVQAAHAIRTGNDRTALTISERHLGTPRAVPERRVVNFLLRACLAATRVGSAGAAAWCARLDQRVASTAHIPIRLDAALVLAECYFITGRPAETARVLAGIAPVVDDMGDWEERWWYLALTAVAGSSTTAREDLTRELARLRLLWGETLFRQWSGRPDVGRVLAAVDHQPTAP